MDAIASSLEVLETRIAPASVLHYTDVDGDKVTITASTGDLTGTATFDAGGHQLQLLSLTAAPFEHANVTFKVVKVAGGDGLANVGYINGGSNDLGVVVVEGDLGQIDAGGNSATIPAIKSLSVRSMGRLGTDTQAAGSPSLESDIHGALGSLTVAGDVKNALINVFGGTTATLGSVTIGGSLIGGLATNSGEILSTGNMGVVKIGHDVQGDVGAGSGLIDSGGLLTSVTLGGSLIGGSNTNSGQIFSTGDMGAVKIAHDILGGTGTTSGTIVSGGKLKSATIGGSLHGAGVNSGAITSTNDMGLAKIGGSMIGGGGSGSGRVFSSAAMTGIRIAGSLVGGDGQGSGEIRADGILGKVTIGHDVIGGDGNFSGRIRGATIASAAVGGSLIGQFGDAGGGIFSFGDLGPVTVGHDVRGGTGPDSAQIYSSGHLTSVTIGGSVTGGVNTNAGEIFSTGDIGAVKVGHDLTGGSITGSASLDRSGLIESGGRIASVLIGGDIISGIDTSSGSLTNNASIRAFNDIGSLTVKGSLIGNANGSNITPVIISARGQHVQGATTDLAIGSVTIDGRVEFSGLVAGYDTNLNPVNADAQIGTVSVGGDWIASSIAAGALQGASGFGLTDTKMSGGGVTDTAGIHSRIAKITIKGQLFGTPDSSSNLDHFGFVAEQIGSVKIDGNSIDVPLNNTPLAIGETDDVSIHLIA